MRLSEAMMLGDSLRVREDMATLQQNADGTYCGCAIGGGILAAGGTRREDYYTLFPWIVEKGWFDISNKFFLVTEGLMTLEQLCDYVKTIEPDCGECNSFNCTCVQKMDNPQPIESLTTV